MGNAESATAGKPLAPHRHRTSERTHDSLVSEAGTELMEKPNAQALHGGAVDIESFPLTMPISYAGTGTKRGIITGEPSVRRRVAQELVETESVLLRTLDELVDVVMPRALAIAPREEVVRVFGNVVQVRRVSSRLYSVLVHELDHWDETLTCVGRAIAPFIPALDTFSLFVQNYAAGMHTLLRSMANSPAVAAAVTSYSSSVRDTSEASSWSKFAQPMQLADMLNQPVQRLPRYVLLLDRMLGATAERHVDHAYLQRVTRAIRQVLDQLNGAVEDAEGINRTLEVEERIVGNRPHFCARSVRRVVREGELVRVASTRRAQRIRNSDRWLSCVLFDDGTLLLASPLPGSLTGKPRLLAVQYLAVIKATASAPATEGSEGHTRQRRNARRGTTRAFVIQVSTADGERVKLRARSEEDFNRWIASIQTTVGSKDARTTGGVAGTELASRIVPPTSYAATVSLSTKALSAGAWPPSERHHVALGGDGLMRWYRPTGELAATTGASRWRRRPGPRRKDLGLDGEVPDPAGYCALHGCLVDREDQGNPHALLIHARLVSVRLECAGARECQQWRNALARATREATTGRQGAAPRLVITDSDPSLQSHQSHTDKEEGAESGRWSSEFNLAAPRLSSRESSLASVRGRGKRVPLPSHRRPPPQIAPPRFGDWDGAEVSLASLTSARGSGGFRGSGLPGAMPVAEDAPLMC